MKLPPNRHWVLSPRDVAFFKYLLDNNGCYDKSIEVIANDTELTKSQASRILKKFKSMGLRRNHHVAA
jgi:predicted transcriptional regulator